MIWQSQSLLLSARVPAVIVLVFVRVGVCVGVGLSPALTVIFCSIGLQSSSCCGGLACAGDCPGNRFIEGHLSWFLYSLFSLNSRSGHLNVVLETGADACLSLVSVDMAWLHVSSSITGTSDVFGRTEIIVICSVCGSAVGQISCSAVADTGLVYYIFSAFYHTQSAWIVVHVLTKVSTVAAIRLRFWSDGSFHSSGCWAEVGVRGDWGLGFIEISVFGSMGELLL